MRSPDEKLFDEIIRKIRRAAREMIESDILDDADESEILDELLARTAEGEF